jgi:NAD(P)-dependent dehydrogenase (short-subunit alcohol dehydrogenase family)
MSSIDRLAGKVAIVTGGTLGIGRGIVERFVSEGATVIATGRDTTRGATLVAEIDRLDRFRFLQQDVTREADWHRLLKAVLEEFGRLDILVNNAAASAAATIAQTEVESFQSMLTSNLTSVFMGMKFGAEAMLSSEPGGSIVNLSSVAAGKGHATLPAYTAAKMGIEGLTRCAALEYGAAGQPIRVNVVRPGYIETDLSGEFLTSIGGTIEQGLQLMRAQHPVGRIGQPQNVAALIAFLASDEAGFITGSVYSTDGGYQA